jgi:hypothetical protein
MSFTNRSVFAEAGFNAFRCTNVEEAPTSPGLYAWYSQIEVGPKDWEYELEGGVDAGIARLRALLEKHTARHEPQSLRIEATGSFNQRWVATGAETSNNALRRALAGADVTEDTEPNYSGVPKMKATLDAPERRSLLVKILTAATPFLTAPLYVGVAADLRQRLQQHAGKIMKVSHWVAGHPDRRRELTESSRKEKEFALRAVAAGFGPDTLVVWTMDLTRLLGSDVNSDEITREVAEAAEWLLNRWQRPSLGRR